MGVLFPIIDFIEDNVDLTASIEVGELSQQGNATAIRQTPTSVVGRYVEGKTFDFMFQLLVKRVDQLKAIEETQAITDILDGLGNEAIQLERGRLIKCEVSTLPNYVEKTPHDEYVYTAIYVAEIEGGH